MDKDLYGSVHIPEDSLSLKSEPLKINKEVFRNYNDLNLSVTLAPHEIKKIINSVGTSFRGESVNLLQTGKFGTENIQQNSASWEAALADSLFTDFCSVLQNHRSGTHNILDVASDFARCCSDVLKIIQNERTKSPVEEVWLEEEYRTWRLLFIIYQDRFLSQNENQHRGITQYFGVSEKLCVENLFKHENLLREAQLIIDWLENNAAERDDEVLHFSDGNVGWENTLHQLHFGKSIPIGSSRQIVCHMNPDSPHYEKKPLHDLDMDDEKSLSKRVFTEIRCGKLEEAQKLCRQSGQSWKAALFEGWRLFHDPNVKENSELEMNSEMDNKYGEMNSKELEEIKGNINRDLWKNMAIKYCKQEFLNPYDRAAVGVFCGYIIPTLPVCNSWKDHLWAYIKSIVDIRVESEIRDCCIRHKEYVPLPDEYWSQRISLNEVFTRLEASKNYVVREESCRLEHVIQKYIILDEIPKMLEELVEKTDISILSTHYLRFIAHLILFLDQIGQVQNNDFIEKILEIYITRLMEHKDCESLIPYYVSKLNPSAQVYLYSHYLEKITDPAKRKMSLTYAEHNGLDVLSITKQVVENIRNLSYELETKVDLQQKITDLDLYKISALDWLNFYDNQRSERLIQTNALIFMFLSLGKLSAAQLAFNKISSGTVEKLAKEENVRNELNLNQIIKEYFSYKAYIDAQEAFNEWFKHSKCKPLPPAEVPEYAQYPEKVAHQHRVSQYNAELERWKLTMSRLSKNSKILLYNVLLFPEGWLSDVKDADYLRSTCIPEVVLLLYSVLSESGHHEEIVQFADIIASEKHRIYEVYSKETLEEILIKICESCILLLNKNKGRLGE